MVALKLFRFVLNSGFNNKSEFCKMEFDFWVLQSNVSYLWFLNLVIGRSSRDGCQHQQWQIHALFLLLVCSPAYHQQSFHIFPLPTHCFTVSKFWEEFSNGWPLSGLVGLCRPLLAFVDLCQAGSLWWELDLDPGWWLKRQHPAASKSNKQERGCNSNKQTKCLGNLLLIVVTSKSLFLIILLKITLGSSQLCCNFWSICVLKVLCILGEGQQTLCPTKLSHPAQTPSEYIITSKTYLSRAPQAVPWEKNSVMWRNLSTWQIVRWRNSPHDRLSCGKNLHIW